MTLPQRSLDTSLTASDIAIKTPRGRCMLANLLRPLLEDAADADPQVVASCEQLAMLEAWRDAAPVLRQKHDASAVSWIARVAMQTFVGMLRPVAPPDKQAYGDGRPSASFQAVIDSAVAMSKSLGLFPEAGLSQLAVLPLGTANSLAIRATEDPTSERLVAFQLGLDELIDGVLLFAMAVEERLPRELFAALDYDDADWQREYSEAVELCLDDHPELEVLLVQLLTHSFCGGYPRGMHRPPWVVHQVSEFHRILVRHAQLFRVGREIGHAMSRQPDAIDADALPVWIGPTRVFAEQRTEDAERQADLIGFAIADAAVHYGEHAVAEHLSGHALVAPDVFFSVLALAEDIVNFCGGSRPALDRSPPARERREHRRQFVAQVGDEKLNRLGERLQLVIEALELRAVPKMTMPKPEDTPLSSVWQSSSTPTSD